jgi:hypothetical protein
VRRTDPDQLQFRRAIRRLSFYWSSGGFDREEPAFDKLETVPRRREQFGGLFDGRDNIAVPVNFLAVELTLSSCFRRECSIRR